MKEKIAGRYADILSYMYLASGALKRFEAEGRPEADRPYFEWAMEYSFWKIQQAFEGILREIKVPGLSWVFRLAGVWGRLNPIGTYPSDKLGHKVAQAMQTRGEDRDRITAGIFLPKDKESAIGRYEHTMELVEQAWPAFKKLYKAIKARELPKEPYLDIADLAVEKGVLTKEEGEHVKKTERARNDAIQVDEFTLDEYMNETPMKPFGDGERPEKAPEAMV